MPNSIDFRADQIQTKQIIVTGSGAGTTKLLIYGIEAQGSPANEGLINTTYFPQSGIGGDVFLYVSGAVGARDTGQRAVSVFGGDLVVSGGFYNDIFIAKNTGELVLSGGIRHAAKFFASTTVTPGTTDTVTMTRNDYLVIMNTQAASGHIYLPEIKDTNKDIGLTVRIRQNDGNTSARTVTIHVNGSNAGYTINGFDAAAATLTLGGSPSGTNTNRSVTLTFMGNISSANRWFVVETSTC